MSSDYIYIFCIPSALPQYASSASSRPPAHSTSAEAANVSEIMDSGPRYSAHVESVNRTRRSRRTFCSPHGNSPLPPVTADVPNDWGPLPARRRDHCRISDITVAQSVQTGQFNVGRGSEEAVLNSVRQIGSINAFPVQNSSFREEASCTDVNGNATTAAFCCLPRCLQVQGLSARQNSTVESQRCRCTVSSAKNCWQQLCNHTCWMRCLSAATFTSFRCLLMFFASLGVGCIISGVVLSILRMTVGSSFLVLSFMFIGMYLDNVSIVISYFRRYAYKIK